MGGWLDRGTVSGKAAAVDHRWVVLARELAAAGLWDHAPPGLRAAEQARIADGGYPFASDVVEEICFFADGEALAEGGVERFLAELAPALRQHGLQLQVRAVQDPYRAGDPNLDYVVEINGIRCTIWEPEEWEVGYPWEDATVRPLAVVNTLLEEAHSSVRAFTLYAGANEGLVLLLDLRVPAAMRASGLFPEREVPSLPVADGQP
jgi:hypothetical protein